MVQAAPLCSENCRRGQPARPSRSIHGSVALFLQSSFFRALSVFPSFAVLKLFAMPKSSLDRVVLYVCTMYSHTRRRRGVEDVASLQPSRRSALRSLSPDGRAQSDNHELHNTTKATTATRPTVPSPQATSPSPSFAPYLRAARQSRSPPRLHPRECRHRARWRR